MVFFLMGQFLIHIHFAGSYEYIDSKLFFMLFNQHNLYYVFYDWHNLH